MYKYLARPYLGRQCFLVLVKEQLFNKVLALGIIQANLILLIPDLWSPTRSLSLNRNFG